MKMDLDLLTWNLGVRRAKGNYEKARDVACSYLNSLAKRKKSFVAAFQECRDHRELVPRLPGAHVHGDGTNALVSSFPLSDGKTYDRFIATRISMSGRMLVVINYHGWDRRNHSDETIRGGAASQFRWLIDEYCGNDDMLIMGDFNAAPTDSEVANRWCLGFSKEHRLSHGRSRTGLCVIRPCGTEMVGTGTLYAPSTDRSTAWFPYDFLVASERLAPITTCKVSVKLAGESVVDGSGIPIFSDHLPVVGKVSLV